jgi:hypothetical protein
VAGTTTLTLPAATDTLVGKATTDTLTNKTLTGAAMNGTVGATTPSTGAFTTLSATGVITVQAGTAAAPAITTTGDTNTGIFFPAADTIAFSEGGVESMRIDSSGRVGIGTTSPSSTLHLSATFPSLTFTDSDDSATSRIYQDNEAFAIDVDNANAKASSNLQFRIDNTERARIDSSGNLLVGTTSTSANPRTVLYGGSAAGFIDLARAGTSLNDVMNFSNANGVVGSIRTTGSTTQFNTLSDYRLKENILPMTGALAKVTALKPCTYTWMVDGESGEGFIAHELAEVCPGAVSGEKDAVNKDGSLKPQGIDTSFLMATLTAAIQEQQALITQLTARITALESA